tara:strand:- start:40 stop:318 length:279 start_codon:yes stop_codon:yes gene_type:complete
MNVLTSNILSYAFSPVIWALKKTTYATYTYFTGKKVVTIGDQIAEQQQTINELNEQVKTLTEYIVDNNIIQVEKSIDLNEFDVVNEDSIVRL